LVGRQPSLKPGKGAFDSKTFGQLVSHGFEFMAGSVVTSA